MEMEILTMPNWVLILGNFGFPVMITIYLLLRFEKKMESLTIVIEKLLEATSESRKLK